MTTVTIPRKEYQALLENKLRFEYVKKSFDDEIFAPPPTRNVKEVVKAFKATGLYNKKFLQSLEKGLKRSSYFKK